MPAKPYEEVVRYIFGNANYSGNPLPQQQRWERFERVLSRIGEPHRQLRVVHIAGTNGKGTTSALCDAMLRASGASVGLFTSPHLHSWRERIRVDGMLVGRAAVTEAFDAIQPTLDAEEELTPFEKLTALALTCFVRAGVDWAVLETGLGGLWDCTNHVLAPVVVGLARIGMDHVNVLGNSVREIASHKAGIMKRGSPAFSVPQPAEAHEVLVATAAEREAPLAFVDAEHSPLVARAAQLTAGAAAGEAAAPGRALPLWLRPTHQQHNLALAAAMIESLLKRGALGSAGASADPAAELDKLLQQAVRARWPGRAETFVIPAPAGAPEGAEGGGRATLVLDVAHNEDAVRALLANLGSLAPAGPAGAAPPCVFEIVFGANKDKDATTMLGLIGAACAPPPGSAAAPRVHAVHLVKSSHPKCFAPADLARIAAEAAPSAPWHTEHGTLTSALDAAIGAGASGAAAPGAEAVITLAFGSVFIVADARSHLAAVRPDVFAADDWAFEQASEPPLV